MRKKDMQPKYDVTVELTVSKAYNDETGEGGDPVLSRTVTFTANEYDAIYNAVEEIEENFSNE